MVVKLTPTMAKELMLALAELKAGLQKTQGISDDAEQLAHMQLFPVAVLFKRVFPDQDIDGIEWLIDQAWVRGMADRQRSRTQIAVRTSPASNCCSITSSALSIKPSSLAVAVAVTEAENSALE